MQALVLKWQHRLEVVGIDASWLLAEMVQVDSPSG